MVPAPLTFFEVDEEAISTNTAKFGEPGFSKAPERFDPVDMIFAPDEFIFVVVNTVVLVTVSNKAVIGGPAIGVDTAVLEDLSPDDGHHFTAGAVLNDADEDSMASLVKPDYRHFSPCGPASLASNATGSKVALIDLHFPGERL